ncbi:MAG: BrnT family toxin [Rhodospirillales bacterium]|nr:BrnT family toxin [Rhodospirillales bacterium]MDH3912853.1 BrnT family toxin [Rhodospirillales bacterium]MDH3919094.1 BrnT family toxin [Rhodospirillales bacterium]MDH3968969.1 BrnT family toxin [Rhodospirillales bacterium]
MEFEWDEDKRRSNIERHGVDFVLAAKIFLNPTLEAPDDRENYDEERMIAIGQWEGNCIVVVYTWRGKTRRIISAWKAGKNDREAYYEEIYD